MDRELRRTLFERQGTTQLEVLIDTSARLSTCAADDTEELSEDAETHSRGVTFHAGYGIKVLRHPDSERGDKLIEYDAEQVQVRPWAIASKVQLSATLSASGLLPRLGMYVVVSILFAALSLWFDDSTVLTVASLNATVSSGLFFLLGPFVTLCLSRWWSMRMDLLGGVWGAIADINLYAGLWFRSGSKADREARALILRYGLAAHNLLYKEARGEGGSGLDELVQKGVLHAHEAAILKPLPSKTQMVFSWLLHFWERALREDRGGLGTSPIPHACTQAPLVLKRCMDGRGAAGGALALVFTQLPFPYVHLLSLLVSLACLVNAVVEGAHMGYVLSRLTCPAPSPVAAAAIALAQAGVSESQPECLPAILMQSHLSTLMILVGWLVSVLVYPIIYSGLLFIGTMLSNPLGKDYIDFPGSFYQHIMKAECKGFYRCIDAVNTAAGCGTQWWGGVLANEVSEP
eukprot:CAMPEP_0119361346 /NCGR_PEP_ID=MMETSP1334-20130426/8675_1 /TAXON_ID=127549 /ORGANISM="Calcidiscus leptoporus, Strain RCC1130" /LENGTH=460 /DNA_ID=CAMNT_0007376333 /DNA_START=51 /DNA_END=1433 /DNA_ORIENTATION=-